MDTQTVSTPSKNILNIDDFKQFYKVFNSATPLQLPRFYHPSVTFKDPLHELKGIAALTQYFTNLCVADTQYRFDFINEVITHNQAFFQWQMHYSHPRLANGEPLLLDGGTLIKFDSLITSHEDFYDMGAMIYQHIPVLGWAVKKINARLTE
jgi:hypothetical protein